MATIFKGAAVAVARTLQLQQQAETLRAAGVIPCLAVVRAGERPDDLAYENGIAKRCEKIGIELRRVVLPEGADTQAVLRHLRRLNDDAAAHGVLIMRPLPGHIDDDAVCAALNPAKDMDGITDASMASVYTGRRDAFAPCTARACLEILDYYGIPLAGKKVTVIGRSLVIGRPVALLMMGQNATVTICHTKTQNLEEACRGAKILVAAAGEKHMVTADYLAAGQVVLDVGIHVDASGSLCGDVDFEAACEIVDAITPVPGGVGTVTSTVLASHVIQAAQRAAAQ